jgi:hypothetical protein
LIAAGICSGLAAPSSAGAGFEKARPLPQAVLTGFRSSLLAAHSVPITAEDWTFDGYYMLHGGTPKAFKGFKAFEVTTVDFTESGAKPIKPYGFVHAGRKYKMTRINILGDSLSFETASIGGVSYQFNGRVMRPYNPNGPVVSGWLMKLVNGKKVVEAQLEFETVEGD